MFGLRKKYDELFYVHERLLERYSKLGSGLEVLNNKYQEFDKIVTEEYGDSLLFLKKQWSTLAWLQNVPSEKGAELLEVIESDVRLLIAKLLEKKKMEVNKDDKKGTSGKLRSKKS